MRTKRNGTLEIGEISARSEKSQYRYWYSIVLMANTLVGVLTSEPIVLYDSYRRSYWNIMANNKEARDKRSAFMKQVEEIDPSYGSTPWYRMEVYKDGVYYTCDGSAYRPNRISETIAKPFSNTDYDKAYLRIDDDKQYDIRYIAQRSGGRHGYRRRLSRDDLETVL